MIKTSVKTCAKLIQPFAFASTKPTGTQNIQSSGFGFNGQRGYKTHDAEKVF